MRTFSLIALLASFAIANPVPEANPLPEASFGTVNEAATKRIRSEEGFVEARDIDLEKRANIGIYLCDGVQWGTPCGHGTQPYYTCIDLGTDWDKKIGSFGPDQGEGYCNVYPVHGCIPLYPPSQPSYTLSIGYPGYSFDDSSVNLWNNQISSFYCYPS